MVIYLPLYGQDQPADKLPIVIWEPFIVGNRAGEQKVIWDDNLRTGTWVTTARQGFKCVREGAQVRRVDFPLTLAAPLIPGVGKYFEYMVQLFANLPVLLYDNST